MLFNHTKYCFNTFFNHLGNALDKYTQNYERFLTVGDFNAEDIESCSSEFLCEYNTENTVKEKTCFSSLTNPSCIDLFLTNFPSSFQNTFTTITTGLSDFHKMVITVMKMTFQKNPPKEIYYRNYKNFEQEIFKDEITNNLNGQVNFCETFEQIFVSTLDKHASFKKKVL